MREAQFRHTLKAVFAGMRKLPVRVELSAGAEVVLPRKLSKRGATDP
jgi:hypothetical protein